ncbi:MAG TPA: AAA family ATPase [Gaiellaceae bacterium]|nr:AAA family ATPase [Gaiellaceae bacterium]
MELLEREGALATLAEAREAAARGDGRVVLVTGEPGIGKTSLVTRFLGDLDAEARVLLGTCDDLSIPRPLGPIRDLAGSVSKPFATALTTGAPPHEIQALLLAELELPPPPGVLVLEDVHWADDATCDAITVLGRRIGALPALLVITFRGGEVGPGHPLYAALGTIPADDTVVLDLAPLSERAVATLVGPESLEFYEATGGNPFYVTELLASRPSAGLPPSVANAVLGRAARLDADARRVVELVSVVPGRVSSALLDTVMPDWPAAAVEPERRQLLEVEPGHVRFRHELARNAIRSSLPIAVRRRLHAEILAALLAADADPAEVVHHAEAAGAEGIVAEYALVAARRAAALESNREAYRHYRRASHFLEPAPGVERARVLEELATAAYVVMQLDDAFAAIEAAIEAYRGHGDEAAVGRCVRVLSRLHWYAGDGRPARAWAVEAIAILEPLGESGELARAYSGLSQLEMLADNAKGSIAWGERALELATRLGDEQTRAHALVNIGSARIMGDPAETATLLEAHAVAHAAGERQEATRALGNLGFSLMWWTEPEQALRYEERALAYAREHEVHNLGSYVETMIAWLRLRAGEWDEAERVVRSKLEQDTSVVQLLDKTVLAELAVRRGDADAAERLADVEAQAERTEEPQRIVPVLELAAERALLNGEPLPTEAIGRLLEEIRPGRFAIRVAAWAAVAGIDVDWARPAPAAQAAMARRDWQAAADAFGTVGWEYDRALMLSLSGDGAALVESLEVARGLGAEPLARRASVRMRELGLRVPHGPRLTTKENPAGLTARQAEVLGLLAEGLTNAEIAERLVVSPRTAEHHVAAVLRKLGATSRRDAARQASALGLAR